MTVVSPHGPAAGPYIPAPIPVPIAVVSMSLSFFTLTIISVCFIRRVGSVKNWKRLPLPGWILVIFYVDSFCFTFVSAILKHLGTNVSRGICEASIMSCLMFYLTAKILVYYFLVEKAYIVRERPKPRLRDKLYIFNCIVMTFPYATGAILSFIWRIGFIDSTGTCIIGIRRRAVIPLLTFDIIVNLYLTTLFLVPLWKLRSYHGRASSTLHTVAHRTFIGSCFTLCAVIANMTVMIILNGEPAWLCFMCCNADIMFSVLVLHWVTSKDDDGTRAHVHGGGGSGSANSTRFEMPDLHPGRNKAIIESDCEAAIVERFKYKIDSIMGSANDSPPPRTRPQPGADGIHVSVSQEMKVEMEGDEETVSQCDSEDRIVRSGPQPGVSSAGPSCWREHERGQ